MNKDSIWCDTLLKIAIAIAVCMMMFAAFLAGYLYGCSHPFGI